MNHSFLIILLSFLFTPTIQWVSPTEHDFGDVKHSEPVEHTFLFRNTGGDTVYVDNVRPSCGCTSPDWDDAGIAPDSTGQIRILYDAKDEGYFYKKIKVYFSGLRKPEILWVEGEVKK